MHNYRQIDKCRLSGSANLVTVLDLGMQSLTGVFPKERNASVTSGPLQLAWCPDSSLLQLRHSYDLSEMYGENYGYRSGLNMSMVNHLTSKIRKLQELVDLAPGDLVVDIGSNDATSLHAYTVGGLKRVGIDPTGAKFRRFYTDGIELVPDFFSAEVFFKRFPAGKARIITSIAMFYDLEDPTSFVKDIHEVLADDGIWHFEQSYMPSMLRNNAFDTICHEHLEYYSLEVVKGLLESCGLKVLDVEINEINGGSFAVTAAKHESEFRPNTPAIDAILQQEKDLNLHTLEPFRLFNERVFSFRGKLLKMIRTLNGDGKKVMGYGASTKGNVLLQFCGLTEKDIPYIVDINPDKFGCYTPGTNIPIISEAAGKLQRPDYFLVLPWHFRNNILERERDYLRGGGKMIFPLPEIEIV